VVRGTDRNARGAVRFPLTVLSFSKPSLGVTLNVVAQTTNPLL